MPYPLTLGEETVVWGIAFVVIFVASLWWATEDGPDDYA